MRTHPITDGPNDNDDATGGNAAVIDLTAHDRADTQTDNGADNQASTEAGSGANSDAVPVWGTPDSRPDMPADTRPDGPAGNRADTQADTEAGAREVLTGQIVATGADARPLLRTRALKIAETSKDRAVRVARHDRTRTALRFIGRHIVYVPSGALSAGRRAWEARSTSRYERMMRGAEASGNVEVLNDWQHRGELFKAARHDRIMTWLHAPVVIAKGLAVGFVTIVFTLLGLGALLASARHDRGAILAPLQAVVMVVNTLVLFLAACWDPFWTLAPWAGLAALWNEGRKRGPVPSWLATASEADIDVAIDENTITRALAALRIPQITAALKVTPLAFITTARRDGRGTYAVLRLPAGVTADRITARRADLATGLYRRANEVWPTTGSEEGILNLWVADKGALAEGAGPYPLLTEGVVDVFKGVPIGKTLRGDPINAPVVGRNTKVGGKPEQGKSSYARAFMAGCSLDITAELRIWVADTNYDFEAFKPRCSQYVMGAENAKIEQIVDGLRALKEEMDARGELLVKYQVAETNRAIASKSVGLHPLACLLEEAHVVFGHPTYGKEASELAAEVVRLGRKKGIHLVISTQAMGARSVPLDISRHCTNAIAFAVDDHHANDGLLGEGAYTAGIRATSLIPGTDAGTAIMRGFSNNKYDTVQVYFISIDRDRDQITPIINRSLKALRDKARPVPGRRPDLAVVPTRRDLLEDLAEVLPEGDPTPAADVPALLARAFPGWAPYRTMTGKTLRAVLETEHGIKVPSTGNRYPLDTTTIRDALTRRQQADTTNSDRDETGDTAS